MESLIGYMISFMGGNSYLAITDSLSDANDEFKGHKFRINDEIVELDIYKMIFIDLKSKREIDENIYNIDLVNRYFGKYKSNIYEININSKYYYNALSNEDNKRINIAKQYAKDNFKFKYSLSFYTSKPARLSPTIINI